jgi:hypothetical protein
MMTGKVCETLLLLVAVLLNRDPRRHRLPDETWIGGTS